MEAPRAELIAPQTDVMSDDEWSMISQEFPRRRGRLSMWSTANRRAPLCEIQSQLFFLPCKVMSERQIARRMVKRVFGGSAERLVLGALSAQGTFLSRDRQYSQNARRL
jgi:hypothetical protein